jgi:hypothetical protein
MQAFQIAFLVVSSTASLTSPVQQIVPNDNRQPAGRLVDGVLRLDLRAQAGDWRPEGERGPVLRVEAFGERDAALMVPSPLIRVPEGL